MLKSLPRLVVVVLALSGVAACASSPPPPPAQDFSVPKRKLDAKTQLETGRTY
ncbi:hypothetical protein [uncultured Alsobacter sp.]|uniref:hypothetical protein n=1 Tax=uncultured Alsobacter sp. TaxID=1748258 RepID=UPI0025DF07ED|nr:hypothetical protein [uncultured Alsobacter sp.]